MTRKRASRVVTAEQVAARKRGATPESQLASRELYTGKVFRLDRDTVRFPDGSDAEMDIIRHSGASAIVPFMSDPEGDDPQLLLLRQFRYAAGGYIYEVPAGRLDGDESPADCAVRELKEETGCTADVMAPLFTMFTTPGFTDEKIHVFMATGLSHGASAREADEFVDVVIVSLAEALDLIRVGEIMDAKTALSILYVAGFKTGN
ncbi:MAG: NUDIX hydrolase [Gemmatimonadaceae bacterium]|nr:NUDIX hydrolase [Gemmatimonadaceae bacterium]